MRKQICALLACCMLLGTLFTLCSCAFGSNTGGIQPGKNNVTRSKIVSYSYFNTVSTIYSYADVSEEEFERYVSTVNDTLSYYHKLFDIYYAYVGINNIQTINKNAGKNPVVVDRELIDFLLYCKELCTITEGKIAVSLTQEDTFLFIPNKNLCVEVRIKLSNGKVVRTEDPIVLRVIDTMDEEVMN